MTVKLNFNYFGHFYNYDAIIGNFILLDGWLLGLFSFISILKCPISRNSHQISHILKVLYSDIRCIFMYVLKLYLRYITYIINIYLCVYSLCVCMYVVHIMNFKINI
jgi:hypothetical protein